VLPQQVDSGDETFAVGSEAAISEAPWKRRQIQATRDDPSISIGRTGKPGQFAKLL